MKNSETDRDFLDLVKKTLDNYEEQYILGSWENFVKARKKRRKMIIWRIGTGIAASLLIGWLGFRLIPSDPLSHSAVKNHTSGEYPNPVIPEVKDTLYKSSVISREVRDNALQSLSTNQGINKDSDNEADNQIISGTSMAFHAESNPEAVPPMSQDAQYTPDTLKAEVSLNQNNRLTGNSDSSGYKPLYKQTDPQISIENDITDRPASQKFRFGVNISPGVASTATASAFNYSGGVNADFAFLPSFRLSTGLQFEHLSVVNTDPSDDPSLPEGETKATLVDLDIPLNITWKFLVRKSTSYYVSGGISSVVYLSEKYANTSYSQQMVAVVEVNDYKPSITYQKENVKTTEQTTEEPLNTFDFASRVNIIFGFEQHLSSKLFLHIEPYIKIPVSDQAAQNIKYTTGGITCKISF